MHEILKPYVEKGLIRIQQHPTRDLFIANYTEQTQFTKAWDDVTTMCRGLIFDGDGKMVARCFPKIFNYEEYSEPLPDEEPEVYEKADGSLGIVTLWGGELVFATRGSFQSEQAIEGQRLLFEQYGGIGWMESGYTYLFEIIYPENRIVLDYGNRRELRLLAKVHTLTGAEANIYTEAKEWVGPTVDQVFVEDPNDFAALQGHDAPNEEGYVLFWRKSGLRLKAKFPTYVRLHKLLTGVHAQHVWERLRNNESLAPLVEMVPDEFFDFIVQTRNELIERYQAVDRDARRAFYMRPAYTNKNRGEYARWVQQQPTHVRPILFALLDGKSYDDIIWKMIKPEADRPFRMGEAA